MNRKNVLSLLLSAVVVLSMSLPLAAQEEAVTIKMVYWPGPESEAMEQVVEYWNTNMAPETGVEVEMVLFSRDVFWERQDTILAAQSPEIDLVYTASYIVGKQSPSLENLEDYLEGIAEDSVFIGSAQDSLKVEGSVYALPLDIGLHFMYYRMDLIDELLSNAEWQARYTEIAEEHLGEAREPKPIEEWDWTDYKAASLFFTQSYNPDSPTEYGTVIQAKNLIYNVMLWNDVLWSMGGSWFDEEANFDFTTDTFADAAMLYADLIAMGASPAGSTSYEYPEANQAFLTGKAAFFIQWSAAFNELNSAETSPFAGMVGISRMPGPEPSTHVHCLGVGLSKYSEHKEAAVEWLTFLATQEAMEMYAANGGVPPVMDVLMGLADQRPEFPLIAEHADLYGYVETTVAETVPILEVLAKRLSAVWAGEVDIAEAQAQAQEEVAALFE